ncbi:MAG: tyrosine-type recombinase/integrase [Burkholderiales bacterium]|nr:tyrosine-type recombinase/integrase [Burkholderiales bacterium]
MTNLPVALVDDPVVSTAPVVLLEPPAPERCPVTLYLLNDLTTVVSRRGMASNLRRAARVLTSGATEDPRQLPWSSLGNAYVARLRALLIEQGAAPSTVNATLAGVKGVLRQAWRLGQLDSDAFLRAVDVKPARGSRVDRTGRVLTTGEQRALFEACADDLTAAGARDAALFALALGGGLRRDELCSLALSDYDHDHGEGVGRLVVSGKGNKERAVPIHNGARDALADWLRGRGEVSGALFLPVNRGGRVVASDRLTGQAVAQAMAKRAGQAGVGRFSPHDCRRTYVSTLLDNGADIATVAALAGHASVETTRAYDRRGERAAVAAAGTIHLPYTSRGQVTLSTDNRSLGWP